MCRQILQISLFAILSTAACTAKTPAPATGAPKPATSNDSANASGSLAAANGNAAGTAQAPAATLAAGTSTAVAAGTGDAVAAVPTRAAFSAAPADYSLDSVKKWADAFTAANGTGYKFIYMPVEQANDHEQMNILRVAMAKAWNHLSQLPALDIPVDASNGAGLLFAVKPATIWDADGDKNWGFIANCTAKANIRISPAPKGDCDSFDQNQPVSIPRFVYNASNGGPYANVMQTPANFRAFQAKYSLGKVAMVSTHHNAIVCGPRITAYRPVTINGVATWYAFTTDEFDGRNDGDIQYSKAPDDSNQRNTGAFKAGPNDSSTAVASEWWIQLPNGFMYWGIHGEGSQERGKAEFPFAIDPANWKQKSVLATGRSCMTCHSSGIQSAHSDDNRAGQNGWTSNDDLGAFYAQIRGKFTGAMRGLVAALSDGDEAFNNRLVLGTVEPIAKAIRLVEGPAQGDYRCDNFCDGKFSAKKTNFCAALPQK